MASEPGGLMVVDLTPEAVDFDLVDRAPAETDIRLALRVVIVHLGESWPHGEYCRNCGAPFPCRLARWGRRVLAYAGYTEAAIAALIAECRRTGRPPWESPLARSSGPRPG